MAEIVQLKKADAGTVDQINSLLKQFNDSKASFSTLQALVDNGNIECWTAQENGVIVGMVTLALAQRVNGMSSRIEDVVVDEAHRGKGLGKALCKKAIERAKARGAYSIHLNSRPARVAANEMYKKLGFELRETKAYHLKL